MADKLIMTGLVHKDISIYSTPEYPIPASEELHSLSPYWPLVSV